jgi:aspartyl-tRNA(Asn)/glutamyl-tRNA(Gln) amidotransferase subunit B
MPGYEMVVGVETHVQLETRTKLFCGCEVRFAAPPNSLVCPVCLGHPGVLPAINRAAFDLALRAALALNCEIAPFTKFDRKNYYYPDLPKSYQISQYDLPLSRDGWVEIAGDDGAAKRVGLVRAHLEEDAGKLVHEEAGARSFIDLNRAGVPLLEIVTKPDLRSPQETHAYLTALKTILQYAGISGCDMEKGQLRCDLNISVRPRGAAGLGTRTEIKNLNSFKFAKRALELEFERHVRCLERGERIVQSTWLYDAAKDETRMMRSKEEAADYRYLPEPDLPPVRIAREWVEEARRALPELPAAKRERLMREYGLSEYDASVLAAERPIADFFEAAAKAHGTPKTVANWVVNELARVLNEKKLDAAAMKIAPGALAELLRLVDAGTVTAASAKEVLAEVAASGRPPSELVRERGLAVITDASAIEAAVDQAIASNAKAVADYRGGKEASLKFLVGQVMKATKGKVKAPDVEAALRAKLRNV